MKPVPAGLPPASSPAWRHRRARDPLGYLRSRSLANPSWRRDMPWLIAYLRRQRPPAGEPLRPCYETAITAAQRYQRLAACGADDLDVAWDAVLVATVTTPLLPPGLPVLAAALVAAPVLAARRPPRR